MAIGASYKRVKRQNMKALRRALRKFAEDRKKAQQRKCDVADSQKRSDEDISATKKARKTDSQAQEQSVATPGDIVPIVFCKRSTDGPQPAGREVGGVWMQPQKIKQGSYGFVPVFLYVISQGEIVSTPAVSTTYVGEDSLTARGGTLPTLTNYYSSTATMAAAPNVCPITSGKIFCHPDATNFISHVENNKGFKDAIPDFYTQYGRNLNLTIGSGDTSNTVIDIAGSGLRVFEVESGTDRTSAYWTSTGLNPATTTFQINIKYGAQGAKGYEVGDIRASGSVDLISTMPTPPLTYGGGYLLLPYSQQSDPADRTWWTYFGSSAEDRPITLEYPTGTINPQRLFSDPATDETLGGVVVETHLSPVPDPSSFDSTYDFTDYADITFLHLDGDIYDASDPVAGDYATTTRQLSVLIESGVKVALYSEGTPGTTGASHHFVDLAMHLFALNKRVVAGTTADIASPIDTSNLQALASFHTNFGLFFNGIIEQSVNIIDFISTMAPFFFLSFVSENGRYALRPLLPLTSGNEIDTTALTVSATFTDSEIIPGSFEKQYVEAEERRDAQISVVFRESKKFRVGLQKSTQIRFANVSSDARVIQYDMTDCCTTGRHARNFAKLQLAIRKHSTHSISFDTPLLTSNLSITDIIKVQRARINNVGDDRTESDHYQITQISHGSDGVTTISAMHFPLNGSNVAEISNEVVNGSFTVG